MNKHLFLLQIFFNIEYIPKFLRTVLHAISVKEQNMQTMYNIYINQSKRSQKSVVIPVSFPKPILLYSSYEVIFTSYMGSGHVDIKYAF